MGKNLNKKFIGIRTKILFHIFVVFIFSGLLKQSFSQQLAFPTAEGYGKYTTGGRGGAVYEVTNLNSSGPGSLGAALSASGPRTVVFKVAGTIDAGFSINNGNITIAGQTAPGDGITIKGGLGINADNVIIRYIRVRQEATGDAISGRNRKNIILDHVSASWSADEVMSIYFGENITIQWCMITEAGSSDHRFGGIWGNHHSTYHHNLFAHNTDRNPRIASGVGYNDVRNNVIYNWRNESVYGGEAHSPAGDGWGFCSTNVVANYFKPGPGTPAAVERHTRICSPWSRNSAADYGNWYVADNYLVGHPDVTADNWKGVFPINTGGGGQDPEPEAIPGLKLDSPSEYMPIYQQTAEEAYISVLDGAGCSLPNRDAVDARIIEEVRNGTYTYGDNGFISHPSDVGGWPALASGIPYADSDQDGMSDDWETANGLNPNDPSDRNGIGEGGYTNLEIFLNSLVSGGPVTGISVSPEADTIGVTATLQLQARIEPFNADNRNVSWSSSDTSVAIVSSSGLVTGVAEGSVAITVTTEDGGFTAESNISVIDLPKYTLTTSVNGQGSISPNSGSFFKGDVVSIRATPETGWSFDGWSGDAGGTDNPLSLTIDTNKTITANFKGVLEDYTFCSNEGETCTFTGTVNVAYGADGHFNYKYNLTGGSVDCNNATFGDPIYGIVKACYVQQVTTSVDDIANSIPSEYKLYEAYPNPFNPETTIKFEIPESGNVKLGVYNILGQEIAVLINDFRNAGTYYTSFHGSDIPSGIYFYRFESNGYSNIKRMLLLK